MRLGEVVIANFTEPETMIGVQRLTEKNFVRAHFFSNEVLILKESKAIKMYKLMVVDDQEEYDSNFRPGTLKFVNYYTLNMTGFISYQPG